jgi:hypothetical protein
MQWLRYLVRVWVFFSFLGLILSLLVCGGFRIWFGFGFWVRPCYYAVVRFGSGLAFGFGFGFQVGSCISILWLSGLGLALGLDLVTTQWSSDFCFDFGCWFTLLNSVIAQWLSELVWVWVRTVSCNSVVAVVWFWALALGSKVVNMQ